MLSLICVQSVLHSDGISERIFQKVNFEKNHQTTKKHEKFPRGGGGELNSQAEVSTRTKGLNCGQIFLLLCVYEQ